MQQYDTEKTIYIPDMCDHAHVLAAALRANGRKAEILPPPDEETLALGLSFCRGHECSPCLTISGDVVRLAQRPNFDPAQAILLIGTTTGSCRFGQYTVLLRQILAEIGLDGIALISPSASDSYQDFGDNPNRIRRQIWEGGVAVDLLQKLLHRYRPYEATPGMTDRIYGQCLGNVLRAVEQGGGRALLREIEDAALRFRALALVNSPRRPIIGVVGEIYLRHNTFTNLEIIRRIEALGGEVELAGMIEWIYYTNQGHMDDTWILGQRAEWLRSFATDRYQRYLERRLAKPLYELLDHPLETPVVRLLKHVRPYFATELANECLLSMGKSIEMHKSGVCGVINVMPFACMPGTITAAMAPRLRADLDGLPWLDIAFDAQAGTNITTRVEAFMYQASEYQRLPERALH